LKKERKLAAKITQKRTQQTTNKGEKTQKDNTDKSKTTRYRSSAESIKSIAWIYSARSKYQPMACEPRAVNSFVSTPAARRFAASARPSSRSDSDQ
jgi:hypothetical protein